MFDTLFIYVPDMKQIIKISEGTGDNLLDEDVEEGYVDYIYYEQYEFAAGQIEETDGGQVMLTELFRDKYKRTEDSVEDVLDMAYGDRFMKYTVLN